MHDAKEMATWNVASWILAMLTRCQTTEANGIKFEPAKWHEPGMRVEVARKDAE
jgi:hypothetical protein